MSSRDFDKALADFMGTIKRFEQAANGRSFVPWRERAKAVCEALQDDHKASGTFTSKELEGLLLLAWTRLTAIEEDVFDGESTA